MQSRWQRSWLNTVAIWKLWIAKEGGPWISLTSVETMKSYISWNKRCRMAIDDVEIQFSSKASLEFVVCLFFETLNNERIQPVNMKHNISARRWIACHYIASITIFSAERTQKTYANVAFHLVKKSFKCCRFRWDLLVPDSEENPDLHSWDKTLSRME